MAWVGGRSFGASLATIKRKWSEWRSDEHPFAPQRAEHAPHAVRALYYSSAPPPKALTQELLERLMPVHFSSVEDAVHGAALVIRGGHFPG
jgi:hypothetical protein